MAEFTPLTSYSCPLGWVTKGNSECQEAQKSSSEQEFFRGEKGKISNWAGTEIQVLLPAKAQFKHLRQLYLSSIIHSDTCYFYTEPCFSSSQA